MIKLTDKTPTVPAIKAQNMSLFPTLDSLQDVIELGESKLPITNKTDLFILLMVYNNTLLKELDDADT